MCNAKAELARRGLKLSDFLEREERLSDVGRGLGRTARDLMRTSELSKGARFMNFHCAAPPVAAALPGPPSRRWMRRWRGRAGSPATPALGCFDFMTFGVPVGIYSLVVGTAEGVRLAVEWRVREGHPGSLAPAALMVGPVRGRQGVARPLRVRGPGVERAAPPRRGGVCASPPLRELVGQLQGAVGGERRRAAGPLPSRRSGRAAVLVAAGGEPAALALYEAEGNVPPGPVPSWPRPKLERQEVPASARAVGGLAALVDEAVGLTRRGGGGEARRRRGGRRRPRACTAGPGPAGASAAQGGRTSAGSAGGLQAVEGLRLLLGAAPRGAEGGKKAKGPLRLGRLPADDGAVRPRAGVRAGHGGPPPRRRQAATGPAAVARRLHPAVH